MIVLHFSVLMLLVLSSCYFFVDPAWKGSVAPCYDTWWAPPCPTVVVETSEPAPESCGPWSVPEMLDMALRNNPDTRVSWQNARIAAYNWEASKSTLFPYLNFQETLELNKENFRNNLFDGDITTAGGTVGNALADLGLAGGSTAANAAINGSGLGYNQLLIRTLTASWLMVDFGGRLAAIESAHQALFSANWIHNREIQRVMLEVLTAYYSYINYKALITATLASLKDAEETMKAAELQFEAGVNTIVDVLQAKTSYVNVQLILQQFEGQNRIAQGQLAKAIGLHAYVEFKVEDMPADLPMEKINEDVEELVAIAKLERPDLAAAQAFVQQKNSDAIVAFSLGMPTLQANGIYNAVRNIHQSSLNSQFYSAMITLNIPIFTGFLYMNQYRAAQASVEAAYATLQSTEAQVYLDVVTYYYLYKTAVETFRYAQELLEFSQKAYDAAFETYKHGLNTILDVLSAQFNLANARTQVIEARTQWLVALANIAYATGTL